MKPILKLQKEPDKVFKSDDGSMVTLPQNNIPETAFNKINELVCATNEIQKQLDCINCAMLDLATPDGENKALNTLLKNKEKKALEIAINILKEIDKTRCGIDVKLYATNHKSLNAGNVFCWTTPDEIHNAIEQINAIIKGE